MIEMQPIAYLRSPWREKFGVPRQPGLIAEAAGEVDFTKEFARPEARKGLEGFSHLWLTFLFDQVGENEPRLSVRPPRLGGNEKVGVFATRSPFRPNRLGLSVCEIEQVFPTLRVRGVDIVDGTPILDIRPYIPYVDALPNALGGFAPEAPPRIEVTASESVEARWQSLTNDERALIEGMISLQPGPAYRGGEERDYHAKVADYEVHWRLGLQGATVLRVEPLS